MLGFIINCSTALINPTPTGYIIRPKTAIIPFAASPTPATIRTPIATTPPINALNTEEIPLPIPSTAAPT